MTVKYIYQIKDIGIDKITQRCNLIDQSINSFFVDKYKEILKDIVGELQNN